jgi:hypothetical protein
MLKKKKGYSRKYDNAPMPFMQMYDPKGIAFHAGANPGYPASHGCVRLPLKFAEKRSRRHPGRHESGDRGLGCPSRHQCRGDLRGRRTGSAAGADGGHSALVIIGKVAPGLGKPRAPQPAASIAAAATSNARAQVIRT